MQFFGEAPERAWVTEASTLLYEGVEPFEAFCAEQFTKTKGKDKEKWKLLAKGPKKLAWDIAVSSAEIAFPMSRSERRQNFTFIYEDPKEAKKKEQKKAESKPKKRKKSLDETPDHAPPSKKRKHADSTSEGEPPEPTEAEIELYLCFCMKVSSTKSLLCDGLYLT